MLIEQEFLLSEMEEVESKLLELRKRFSALTQKVFVVVLDMKCLLHSHKDGWIVAVSKGKRIDDPHTNFDYDIKVDLWTQEIVCKVNHPLVGNATLRLNKDFVHMHDRDRVVDAYVSVCSSRRRANAKLKAMWQYVEQS